jgi:hypothetical protein
MEMRILAIEGAAAGHVKAENSGGVENFALV